MEGQSRRHSGLAEWREVNLRIICLHTGAVLQNTGKQWVKASQRELWKREWEEKTLIEWASKKGPRDPLHTPVHTGHLRACRTICVLCLHPYLMLRANVYIRHDGRLIIITPNLSNLGVQLPFQLYTKNKHFTAICGTSKLQHHGSTSGPLLSKSKVPGTQHCDRRVGQTPPNWTRNTLSKFPAWPNRLGIPTSNNHYPWRRGCTALWFGFCFVIWDSFSCCLTELWTYYVPEAGFERLHLPASTSQELWVWAALPATALVSCFFPCLVPIYMSSGSESTATKITTMTVKTHWAPRLAQF